VGGGLGKKERVGHCTLGRRNRIVKRGLSPKITQLFIISDASIKGGKV